MTDLISDPTDLLRPISTAAKLIGAPILQNARDHSHYQHLLVQQLTPILNGLEEPLRMMKSTSPYLGQAATDELQAIAKELGRLSRSMAGPNWWTRFIFWRLADCRPVFKKFSSDLSSAASLAASAQPKFAAWKAGKPHPQYIGELDGKTLKEAEKFWARKDELESLRLELEAQLDAAKVSRKVADEFFHDWMQGKGFVKKPKRSKATTS
uniref:hypothetical protein n=1 Tax=Paenarthrobacter ureafaciens TaxID=37931 RepID=UPI003F494045